MTQKPDYMWQADGEDVKVANIFETRSELIRRRLSIIIINIVGFINSLGFSIVLTGAYPYLLQIDETADKVLLGWIVAANPLGQLIASPIVGWLGNRWKSVRWLCISTGVLNMIGFILYACLGGLPQPRKYWMMVARFIVGLAAGSITLCITYISKATTTKERTTFISINALAQTLGFIVGPVIQTSLIPLGQEGIHMGIGDLRFNMYTTTGWLAAACSLIYVILLMPGIFQEFDMAEKEAQWTKMKGLKTEAEQNESATATVLKRDVKGAILCLINFSMAAWIIIMIEGLATPIAMDLLAYSEEEAVQKVGILLSVACVLTALAFASSGPLAKRLTERKVLLFFGLVPMIVAQIIMLPYGGSPPLMQETSDLDSVAGHPFNETGMISDNATALALHSLSEGNSTRPRGCPQVQTWCLTQPAPQQEQLIVGFVLSATAFAYANAMSTSTLTQVLGPGQQGTWTGVYLAGGSLSRILSPLLLTSLYTNYGTYATFGCVIAILVVVLTANFIFYKHLIPLNQRSTKKP